VGKRKLSPEHLAKLQAGREKAREKKLEKLNTVLNELPTPEAIAEETRAPDQSVTDLKRQLDEVKATMFDLLAQSQSSNVAQDRNGGIVGTFEKYTVDPANYPDPTERLSREPRLIPLAFDYNYELDYQVHVSQYETKDGRNVKEPRFMMELRRVVLDDMGQRTADRYIIRKLTFHEDPQAAIQVARENGVDVDSFNDKDFLDEMRYIRVRDWLLDIFYPPKAAPSQAKNQVVVDNQVVEMITINSENSTAIPFGKLGSKLKTS
jgi:hypothetical protein